jgi:DNA-binding MarR family transcriptional regulator
MERQTNSRKRPDQQPGYTLARPENCAGKQDQLRVELAFLISHVTRMLRRRFDIDMAPLELTRAQWRAMLYVFRLSNPTQTELAEILELGRASVGSLIDQLERSGYVSRVADSDDRRVWRIVPSRLAVSRQSKIAQAGKRAAAELFAEFDEQDLRDFRRCLEKLMLGAE